MNTITETHTACNSRTYAAHTVGVTGGPCPAVVSRVQWHTHYGAGCYDRAAYAVHTDTHRVQDFTGVCADLLAGRGLAAGARWVDVHFAWAEVVDAAGGRWVWVCPVRGGYLDDFGLPTGGPADPSFGYCPACFALDPDDCEGLGGCVGDIA